MAAYPDVLIDMHTHLFNARYVPLKEIFVSKGIAAKVSGLLARLVLTLTGKTRESDLENAALTAGQKIDIDENVVTNIAALTISELTALSVGAMNATRTKGADIPSLMADEAFQRIEETDLYQVAIEINRLYGDLDQDPVEETKALMRVLHEGINQEEAIFAKSASELFYRFTDRVKRFIRSALEPVENSSDFLEFVWTMLLNEEHILKRLMRNYGRHAGVDLLVHHMMDMEHPFDGKTHYPFYSVQLSRMKDIERDAKGQVIGFSAFDPIRCVDKNLSDKEIIQLLEIALGAGKRGFKFYPPMGFKAAGNTDRPKVEHAIDVFLDYCVEHNIPVFTHCTPEGFEQTKGTGVNSHPRHWRAALTKKASRRDLILCFGHAGGGHREILVNRRNHKIHGWLADPKTPSEWDDPENYARSVVELCTTFPNVFCELANFHEILDSQTDKANLQDNLIKQYRETRAAYEAGKAQYALEDKMMYGSDWHMPSMVNDVDEYLKLIVDIYSSEALSPVAENFFFKNAVRYLRLAEFIPIAQDQFGAAFADHLETLVLRSKSSPL